MHTSTEVWGPDAREFNPDRWLGGKAAGLEAYLTTFSKGSRGCIGMKYVPSSLHSKMGQDMPATTLLVPLLGLFADNALRQHCPRRDHARTSLSVPLFPHGTEADRDKVRRHVHAHDGGFRRDGQL